MATGDHIQAGRLRHRVTIQEQQQTQDPNTGATTTAWVEVAKVWAAIEPLSVREFVQSAAAQSQVTARITIRYRQIDASMRLVHGATIYNIAGVLADKESGHEYLTLPVSAGVNGGE